MFLDPIKVLKLSRRLGIIEHIEEEICGRPQNPELTHKDDNLSRVLPDADVQIVTDSEIEPILEKVSENINFV